MAQEINFTEDDEIFVGEDKELVISGIDDGAATPTALDVSAWTMTWMLRKTDIAADPALLTKATGGSGITVSGVFNASPALNAQVITIRLNDTDTAAADGTSIVLKPLTYRHSLKRMTADSEAILVYGDFVLREATVR
jgi:hypothetical protein